MRIIDTITILSGLAAIVVILGLAGPVTAADAELGKRVALDWCSACHLVTPEQKAPVPDTAPSFMELAQDPRGADYIGTFLQAPHFKNMKGIDISRFDIEDIVAYVSSLKKQ
jgi:mono/diheme cytochrome c family protein